jgi:pyrroline-5-carboxylate reductase
MDFGRIATNGMVLLGCGKMGSAMLAGWLDGGLAASSVTVLDPYPSDWLKSLDGLHLNTALPDAPALVLIAVKPQMMGDALPSLQALGNGATLFVSVAAGTSLATYAEILGAQTPVIRAMPNTPAAVARGITAVIGNPHTSADHMTLARTLLSAVGEVVDLDSEDQMDAVTGLSGSGPAYVFHLIEAMAAAGEAQGLAPELAMKLAQATVSGAGELARLSDEGAAQLRVNVTSPNGTTAAGLGVLMDADAGLPPLMRATVAAAADRSRELSK